MMRSMMLHHTVVIKDGNEVVEGEGEGEGVDWGSHELKRGSDLRRMILEIVLMLR